MRLSDRDLYKCRVAALRRAWQLFGKFWTLTLHCFVVFCGVEETADWKGEVMAADLLLMRSLTRLRQVTYQCHILSVQRRERPSLAQNPLKEHVSVHLPHSEGPDLTDKRVILAFNNPN